VSKWTKKFRFAAGNILRQLTVERMNSILNDVDEARPAPGGHVGMTIRTTPYGWVGVVRDRPNPAAQMHFTDHPWKLFQADDDIPGLIVSMSPGMVQGINAASSNPLNASIFYTPAVVTDDETTLFWVKVSIELIVYSPFFKVWAIAAAEVETGTALPADTLDIATLTDGDVHVLIGTVIAASGEVTDITQALSTPLAYNLPPILSGPETGVYVLVSTESVVDWQETAEFECPTE